MGNNNSREISAEEQETLDFYKSKSQDLEFTKQCSVNFNLDFCPNFHISDNKIYKMLTQAEIDKYTTFEGYDLVAVTDIQKLEGDISYEDCISMGTLIIIPRQNKTKFEHCSCFIPLEEGISVYFIQHSYLKPYTARTNNCIHSYDLVVFDGAKTIIHNNITDIDFDNYEEIVPDSYEDFIDEFLYEAGYIYARIDFNTIIKTTLDCSDKIIYNKMDPRRLNNDRNDIKSLDIIERAKMTSNNEISVNTRQDCPYLPQTASEINYIDYYYSVTHKNKIYDMGLESQILKYNKEKEDIQTLKSILKQAESHAKFAKFAKDDSCFLNTVERKNMEKTKIDIINKNFVDNIEGEQLLNYYTDLHNKLAKTELAHYHKEQLFKITGITTFDDYEFFVGNSEERISKFEVRYPKYPFIIEIVNNDLFLVIGSLESCKIFHYWDNGKCYNVKFVDYDGQEDKSADRGDILCRKDQIFLKTKGYLIIYGK